MRADAGDRPSRRTSVRRRTEAALEKRARLIQIEDLVREARARGATRNAIALQLLRNGWSVTVEEARAHVEAFEREVAAQHARVVTGVRKAVLGEFLQFLIIAVLIYYAYAIHHQVNGDSILAALVALVVALIKFVRLYRARKSDADLDLILESRKESRYPGQTNDDLESPATIEARSMQWQAEALLRAQDAGVRRI